MKTQSPVKLETYQVMGRKLRINFSEQTVSSEGIDEAPSTTYQYNTAEVDKLANRDKIIEAIMATRYPTFGSELAAIRNGGAESQEHEDLRVLAKSLADGWLQEVA